MKPLFFFKCSSYNRNCKEKRKYFPLVLDCSIAKTCIYYSSVYFIFRYFYVNVIALPVSKNIGVSIIYGLLNALKLNAMQIKA